MGRDDAEAGNAEEIAEQRRGTVIAGRYRIEDLTSFGGMGALYRARDLRGGKPCALRVLPESYRSDQALTSRFMREAQAATALEHPNIIDVFDSGRLDDGSVYSAMELLDGQSIAGILNDEWRLSPSRAVHVATQICRALGSAHENGIIHRDLKPESVVLIAHEGDLDFVKVVDFGICKHVPSEAAGAPRLIIGTPDYMAPEQAAGIEANEASDIYALGTILYEMLTGARPFTGRNAIEVLRQKEAGEPPRADVERPEVPRALAELVARCMARRPEDRPDSMRVLELELMRSIEPSARVEAVSDLPPPPEAGSLRVPIGVAQAAIRDAGISATRAMSPESTKPVVRAPGAAQEAVNQEAAKQEAAKTETARLEASGQLRPAGWPLPAEGAALEDGAAASSAGRSIVPITLLAVAAAAVVLFVWPGVLRERGEERTPERETAGSELPEAEPGAGPSAGPSTSTGLSTTSTTDTGPSATSATSATSTTDTGPSATSTTLEGASEGGGDPGGESGEFDAVLVVSKLELAALEGRWRAPQGDNVAALLTSLSASDPKNEAIKRVRKQATEVLMARGDIASSEKRWHDAVENYRDLYAIAPDHKPLAKPFTEALQQDAKLLRYIRDWRQLLEVADDLVALSPRSFEAVMLRAEALEGLSQWAEALAALKTAKGLKASDKGVAEAIKRVETRAKAAGGG